MLKGYFHPMEATYTTFWSTSHLFWMSFHYVIGCWASWWCGTHLEMISHHLERHDSLSMLHWLMCMPQIDSQTWALRAPPWTMYFASIWCVHDLWVFWSMLELGGSFAPFRCHLHTSLEDVPLLLDVFPLLRRMLGFLMMWDMISHHLERMWRLDNRTFPFYDDSAPLMRCRTSWGYDMTLEDEIFHLNEGMFHFLSPYILQSEPSTFKGHLCHMWDKACIYDGCLVLWAQLLYCWGITGVMRPIQSCIIGILCIITLTLRVVRDKVIILCS